MKGKGKGREVVSAWMMGAEDEGAAPASERWGLYHGYEGFTPVPRARTRLSLCPVDFTYCPVRLLTLQIPSHVFFHS
jgi:hypothetical protein